MTAGYISAEAYSMLKPKARFHELDLNEHYYILTILQQRLSNCLKMMQHMRLFVD